MGNPHRLYKRILCIRRRYNCCADTSEIFLPRRKKSTCHIYYNYTSADSCRCFNLFPGRFFRYARYYQGGIGGSIGSVGGSKASFPPFGEIYPNRIWHRYDCRLRKNAVILNEAERSTIVYRNNRIFIRHTGGNGCGRRNASHSCGYDVSQSFTA